MSQDLTILKNPKKIERIAKKGKQIYAAIEKIYEPKHHGKYIAIEVESQDVFLGETGVEAATKAEKKYPDKLFYIAKVGFEGAETILRYLR